MRINRYAVLFVLLMFLITSCTKDVDIQLELSNTDKNVTITIKPFPPEPWGSTMYWEREILVYRSYEDFMLKHNPIFDDFTMGFSNNNSVVTLNGIKEDVLYLRVILWESIRDTEWKFNKGAYYYNDSITIPEYYCNTIVYTSDEKWEQE